jgi:hypothetical protein
METESFEVFLEAIFHTTGGMAVLLEETEHVFEDGYQVYL